MKKTIKLFIAGAFALMPIVACQKEEVAFTSTDGLSFTSTKPILEDETKTAWNGTSIHWSNGDAIRVAYTCDGVWQNADGTATADEASGSKTAKVYQSNSLSADAETAQFTVPGNFKGTAEGTYVFYGAYPASACTDKTDFSSAPSLTVTIPSTQTPAADSYDSAADFMLGISANTYTGIPTEAVSMSWDRMVAHAQLTFKTLNGFTAGETISKVELTADLEADMVGKHFIDLETKNVTKQSSTVANALTINGTNLSVDETGTFVAWASFLPCTVNSLTVVVTTDKATYTREIASCELVFKKNARNVLAVNMSSAIREVTGVASLPFEETFDAIITGNSTSTGGSGTKVTEDLMANFSNYATNTYQAGGAVRIGKSGSLETKNLDLSKNFYVVVTAKGWSSSEVKLTISAGEQSETVTLETYIGDDYKDYIVSFNAVSSSSTVKFTTNSSTRCFIDKISIVEDNRTPLNAPENLSCTAQTANSLTFSWDAVANATGYKVSVDGGSTYGATQTETTYTWTGLSATTTKTLYVKAIGDGTSYTDSDAVSAEGTTTAAANANDGSLEKPFTAAEAITAIDAGGDLTNKYVKGVITEVTSFNSTYGSITYNIESGEKTLQVYSGLDLGKAQFSAIDDLKVGDEVLVCGTLKKFNTTYEFDYNNYIVTLNGETEIYAGLKVSGQTTTFNVGDEFVFGGTVVQDWRGKDDVNVTSSASFSGYDMNAEGTQTVTVTVGNESTTYKITVKDSASTGGETVTYTALFGASYNSGKVQNYTSTWSATNDNFTVNLVNWNNNQNGWNYIKGGAKSSTSGTAKTSNASITTSAAIPEAISSIVITLDAIANGSITSVALETSTDSNFTASNTVETKTDVTEAGDITFSISSPQQNLFYRIVFNFTNSTTKNGIAQVSKVTYSNN